MNGICYQVNSTLEKRRGLRQQHSINGERSNIFLEGDRKEPIRVNLVFSGLTFKLTSSMNGNDL